MNSRREEGRHCIVYKRKLAQKNCKICMWYHEVEKNLQIQKAGCKQERGKRWGMRHSSQKVKALSVLSVTSARLYPQSVWVQSTTGRLCGAVSSKSIVPGSSKDHHTDSIHM